MDQGGKVHIPDTFEDSDSESDLSDRSGKLMDLETSDREALNKTKMGILNRSDMWMVIVLIQL